MMCRQVLPDSNGIEQIYIVKSEPTDEGDSPATMAPEDVDKIKQEPSSEGDDELEPHAVRKEQTYIKDEAMDTNEPVSYSNTRVSGSISCPDHSQKPSEERFACHCGMTYWKEILLIQHKRICDIPEDITNNACRFCQQTFQYYSNMLDHVRQLHGPGMPETKCFFCTDRFKNAALLVIHEIRHQLPNVIKCDQCNRIFRQHSNLQRHLKVHSNGVETFSCDTCGKTFTQSENLEIHVRIHSGTRPCSCDLCPMSFYCPSTLRLHRLTHFKAHVEKRGQVSGEKAIQQVEVVAKFTGKNEL